MKRLNYNELSLESLSNSDLKKLGDYWLRQFLLSKQQSTYYFCPLKRKSYSADNMHVAHFIDRGVLNTRFDLINCHLVSANSNTYDAQIQVDGFKSEHHKEYEEFLIAEYGIKEFEKLKLRGKELKMFTQKDYIEIIKKFRDA